MSTSGGSSGGGSSFPNYTGVGSPEGVQTAVVGKSYVDTTNGALYWKGSGSGNTGWVIGVGAESGATIGDVYGVAVSNAELNILSDVSVSSVFISDRGAFNGTGNGISYNNSGADGTQNVVIGLGSTDQFRTKFNADGSTQLPGTIATVPPPSHTVDAALGSLTLGTAFRNTLAYDAEALITIVVTAATAATVVAGVGPTTTPTQDAVIPSFSTAALEIINLRFRIPAGQYLLLSTGGTITVSSTTTWCQAG